MTLVRSSMMPRPRSGFTLVEILVVIVIISILAAISIPAITGALATARTAGMQTELASISQGIDAYKLKYGDYPPDFSSWTIVERHYRKAFPDISQSELLLLHRLIDGTADTDSSQMSTNKSGAIPGNVMDRAEAVVWSLGGFSSDPQRPFTGTGGPLQFIGTSGTPGTPNPALYQYNADRDNAIVDFEASQLSVQPIPTPGAPLSVTNRTQSDDEAGTDSALDVFPTYILYDDASPVVYFDSRTYTAQAPSGAFNGYGRPLEDGDADVVRPLFSMTPNPPPASGYGSASLADSLDAWQFVNPRTFQLLAPGLDRIYGKIADVDGGDPSDAAPVYFQYPSGQLIAAQEKAAATYVPGVEGYDLSTKFPSLTANYLLDNLTNFSEGSLGDELP